MVKKGVAVELEALRRELQVARDTEKPSKIPSLREAVGVLLPELEALRRAKWSDVQITEWLGKRKLEISPGTLTQYMREARRIASATGGDTKPVHEAERLPKQAPGKPPKVRGADSNTKVDKGSEDISGDTPNADQASADTETKPKPRSGPMAPAASGGTPIKRFRGEAV